MAVPPSKSFTNRALLLGAIAPCPVRVRRPLDCDDADALIAALSAAGIRIRRDGEDVTIEPGRPPASEAVLDVRDSGTACRFLTAYAAATPGLTAVVTGSARLCERPIGGLVDALRALGAEISCRGAEGFPPLAIRGTALAGGPVGVSAAESSQYASALLLAAPRFRDGLDLRIDGPGVSRAYLDTTREALGAAGILVGTEGGRYRVAPGAAVSTEELDVPGDWSAGATMAAAVAIAGGTLRLDHLPWPSTQADARALEVLRAMGVEADTGPRSVSVSGRARRPIAADAADFPDAVPVLAAVAARLEGESTFRGIAHLRLKESDRISALSDLFAAAGIACRPAADALAVVGSRAATGALATLPTRGDHRIVMAATLLAFGGGGFVERPRAVAKSYPRFFRDVFAV